MQRYGAVSGRQNARPVLDVDCYVGREGLFALREDCRKLADRGDVEELVVALSAKAGRTYEKHEVPRLAAAALLSVGPEGVDRLIHFIAVEGYGAIRGLAALRALWLAASHRQVLCSSLGFTYPEFSVDAETRSYARATLDDFISSAPDNPDHYDLLLQLQTEGSWTERSEHIAAFASHVIAVLRDSSLILTAQLIEQFEDLVRQDLPERDYQSFLASHPIFLDPLAAEVIDRKRLGAELITDFVVRRHDDTYVVVEIEKPQDRLFTLSVDFTAQFSHASLQVLDFQGWLTENIAYAQRTLPNIETPQGLLVMGRRGDMTGAQQAKLRRWIANSRRIDVVTFDDLSARARALHASLRRNV